MGIDEQPSTIDLGHSLPYITDDKISILWMPQKGFISSVHNDDWPNLSRSMETLSLFHEWAFIFRGKHWADPLPIVSDSLWCQAWSLPGTVCHCITVCQVLRRIPGSGWEQVKPVWSCEGRADLFRDTPEDDHMVVKQSKKKRKERNKRKGKEWRAVLALSSWLEGFT